MKREEIKTYKDACKVNGLGLSNARVGASLKIKEREDGNYIIENFKELLQDWSWGD